MPAISLQNISKFVGMGENRQQILKNINLTIERGEFVAIIGQSGSGKSTLMNMIGFLDTPSSGSYYIMDQETTALEADALADLRSRTFGFIFQRYNLLGSLSAVENVALPGVYAGMTEAQRGERAGFLLESLELGGKLASMPNELSGGQQQRVSIARALMNGGDIILADEPTGALDSQSGLMVMGILNTLNQQGHTIILVTHDPNVAAYAKRVIEIKDGAVISERWNEKKPDTANRQATLAPQLPNSADSMVRFKALFKECFKMAVQSIGAHKLRSSLTMLGIIIGIASVILVIAMGQGSQEQILERISRMGTNTINIFRGKSRGDQEAYRITTLIPADAEALAAQSYIDGATPEINTSGTLVHGNRSFRGSIIGVGEQAFRVQGLRLKQGRLFTESDVLNSAAVAVIDESALRTLFPHGGNPVGAYVLLKSLPIQIVGVIHDKLEGRSSDSVTLYTPYTTVMYKLTGTRNITGIVTKVADGVNTEIAEKNIEQLLISRHGEKDFFTYNMGTVQQVIEQTTDSTTLLISGIASVSLLVGGIGVMNIMLVSVTERTAEIGLRMAIGARRSSILAQFLIEAILLCLLGGIIGMLFAVLLGETISFFKPDFPLKYSVASFFLSFFCSTAIGIVFGFIPARNASRLNPIEALSRD